MIAVGTADYLPEVAEVKANIKAFSSPRDTQSPDVHCTYDSVLTPNLGIPSVEFVCYFWTCLLKLLGATVSKDK